MENKIINNLDEAKAAAEHEQFLRNAIKIDFALTPSQIKNAETQYAPLRFKPGLNPTPAHPIAALHQRFAYNEIKKIVKNIRPIIEIGPNVTQFLRTTESKGATHACCLFGGRDQIRYRDAAVSRYVTTHKDAKVRRAVSQLATNLSSDLFCTQGFQNCQYEAPVAYSVHSLYDIDPKDLAVGFEKHRTHTVYAFMHIAPAILVTDNYYDEKNQIMFKVIDKSGIIAKLLQSIVSNFKDVNDTILYNQIGNLFSKPFHWLQENLKGVKVVMGFPEDPTFAYEHDYSNILFYTRYGGINTPFGFALVFERQRSYGSNTLIKISKVTYDLSLHHFTQLDLSHMVRVPDILRLGKKSFKHTQAIEVVWYDRNKIRKLYTYLLGRKDKEMTIENAINYARTELRAVIVKNEVIDQSWDLSINEFNSVVVAVYVMAYLEKTRMMSTIRTAVDEINHLARSRSGWEKFVDKIKQIFSSTIGVLTEIKAFFGGFDPALICDDRNKLSLFSRLIIDSFEDIHNVTYLTTDNYSEELYPQFTLLDELESDEVLPPDTIKSEPQISTDPTLKPVYGEIKDHGGNGDCFYRVADRIYSAEIMKEIRTKLPETWVDFLDAFTELNALHQDVSILVRRGEDSAVYTNDPTKQPRICLTVPANSTNGHYTEIVTGPNKICDATLHMPLKGGAKVITSQAGVINLTEPQSQLVVNAVKPIFTTAAGLNGFAAQVAENHLGGEKKYLEMLVAHTKAKSLHFVSTNAAGGQILNIIAKGPADALLSLRKYLSSTKNQSLITPLIGGGVWNNLHLTEVDVFMRFLKYWKEIDEIATMNWHELRIITEFEADLPSILDLKKGEAKTVASIPATAAQVQSKLMVSSPINTVKTPKVEFKQIRQNHIVSGNIDPYNKFATLLFETVQREHQIHTILAEFDKTINEANDQEAKALAVTLTMARDALKNQSFSAPPKCKFEGHYGVPGAGKTNALLEDVYPNYKPDQMMYIAPTNELAKAMNDKTGGDMQRSFTLHRAMGSIAANRHKRYKVIIIDEAFTLPLPLILYAAYYTDRLILMGDPKQIGFIDFNNMWGEKTQLIDLYQKLNYLYRMQTYRLPKDIVDIPLIRKSYPGITTKSTKYHSLMYPRPEQEINGVHLVFTREMKTRHSSNKAITVHEAQGGTFPSVVLHYDNTPGERELVSRSNAHLIVALTRHTNNLYIMEKEPGSFGELLKSISDIGKIEIVTEASKVEPLQSGINLEPPQYANQITDLAPGQIEHSTAKTGATHIDDILQKIYPVETKLEEYIAAEPTDLGGENGGRIKLNLCLRNEDKPEKPVKRFPIPQRVFVTDASRKHKTMQTLITRYTKVTQQISNKELDSECRKLMDVIDYVINDYTVTAQELSGYLEDAISAYQAKGHDTTELEYLDWWRDHGNDKVTFMMKHQQKPDLINNALTKVKAGQGIAAWQKTLNFFVNIWTRALEHKIKMSTKVIFPSGKSDTEMLKLLDTQCRDRNLQYLAVDWTEFDSSQNNLEHELLDRTLAKLGCPDQIRQIIMEMKHTRYIQHQTASGIIHSKKDSGAPDTLIGNTLFNMAVILSSIDNYKSLTIAAFKGDDAILAAPVLIPNVRRMQWLESNANYRFKLERGSTGEFTTFILSPRGTALNLPRIATKVFTRIYKNEKLFDEYVKAVDDLTQPLKDCGVLTNMAKVNALHHDKRGTQEDFEALAYNIRAFAAGQYKFKDLHDYSGYILENLNAPHPLPLVTNRKVSENYL